MGRLPLRRDPVSIKDEEPFAEDLLSRKGHAEVLTALLRIVDGPAVLSLESPWGTGKTTFLRMWSASMRKRGFPVATFNAWNTDYAADPFVALSSKITEAVGGADRDASSAVAKTREAAKVLATRTLPGIARLLTAGVINLPADLEAEITKMVGKAVDDGLEEFERTTQSVEAFKLRLGVLAEEILAESGGLPLIVFIDELDRCRPNYAVELLERAKHLFSVKGVIFVLALDREQLINAVRAVYGPTFDAVGYLRRFIDFDYRLPPPDPEAFMNAQLGLMDLERFLERTTDPEAEQGMELVRDFLVLLPPHLGLSLRQMEQLVIRLGIVLEAVPGQQLTFLRATVLALLLRTWRPELYRKFISRRATPDDVAEALEGQLGDQHDLSDHQCRLIEATVLSAGRDLGMSSQRIVQYKELVDSEEAGDDQVYHAKQVLRLYKLGHRHAGIGFRPVADRIGLVAENLFAE